MTNDFIAEGPDEWTEDSARAFLQRRNELHWGDEYTPDKELDFFHFATEFQVNLIISNLLFAAKTEMAVSSQHDALASEGAAFLERGKGKRHPDFELSMRRITDSFMTQSDHHLDNSDSALETALRTKSAAEFLGIPIDQSQFPTLDLLGGN